MVMLQKITLKFNIKYIYNICILNYKKIYLYSLYYYVVFFEFDLVRTSRVIECSGRLLWGTYCVFLSVLCYNNMDIAMFIQDLLNKYIIHMSDLFNVNMSSASGNGNSLPPIGGEDGDMNGTPMPGGSGNDLSLVLAGNSSNNNDQVFQPPRSDIVPRLDQPHRRVEWDYINGKKIKGGFVVSRDGIFLKDHDKRIVSIEFFESRYNEKGEMYDCKKIYHNRGLLAGTNEGYGIGRIIWNNQYYYGFIIPQYPSFHFMPRPGIEIGENPFSIRANFNFPDYIFKPEKTIISDNGKSLYVELGIQYKFFYINPRNLYICELTYPNGYQEKITNLRELSDFILNHRSEVLECSIDIIDQINIMSSPRYIPSLIPGLNVWIEDFLDTVYTPSDIPKFMDVYHEKVQMFLNSPRFNPPSFSSLSAPFELEATSGENENNYDNVNSNGIT